MAGKHNILTQEEVAGALTEGFSKTYGLFITPEQLAQIAGVGRSTIYQWMQQGRLDGSFRRRGKHVLIWRDRAILALFNGPEWSKK